MLMMRSPLLSAVVISMLQSSFPLMHGCWNLQSARPLMLMMRSPLLSDVVIFNVAEQFPSDARVLEPAKRSAADAYDASL